MGIADKIHHVEAGQPLKHSSDKLAAHAVPLVWREHLKERDVCCKHAIGDGCDEPNDPPRVVIHGEDNLIAPLQQSEMSIRGRWIWPPDEEPVEVVRKHTGGAVDVPDLVSGLEHSQLSVRRPQAVFAGMNPLASVARDRPGHWREARSWRAQLSRCPRVGLTAGVKCVILIFATSASVRPSLKR